MHWLGSGFIIGLNENGTNFREMQETIVYLTKKWFNSIM